MVNFAKQPRVNKDGLRRKRVVLQRVDVRECLEALENRTSVLAKTATQLCKNTKSSKAVASSTRFSASFQDDLKKCRELSPRAKVVSSFFAITIEEVARRIPERRVASEVFGATCHCVRAAP